MNKYIPWLLGAVAVLGVVIWVRKGGGLGAVFGSSSPTQPTVIQVTPAAAPSSPPPAALGKANTNDVYIAAINAGAQVATAVAPSVIAASAAKPDPKQTTQARAATAVNNI